MTRTPINLDQNATTPLDPSVLEAMRPHWLAAGNAESRHAAGRSARRSWDAAVGLVAEILGAGPADVVFTSGGTEANNLAMFGLVGSIGGRALISPIEHPAVAEAAAELGRAGLTVDLAGVGPDGLVDAAAMAGMIGPETRLAALMLANNETGAIQPVAELARMAAERGVPVHTDAVQAVGRIPVQFKELGVATLAASGHKFHGPAGVGVLLIRPGVTLPPRLFGGGQQKGRRPGTAPVALAVGLAEALRLWHTSRLERIERWTRLRDRLEAGLVELLGPAMAIRNGPRDNRLRLPQTLNVGFPGLDGESLLMQLDLAGVAASLGSACASGSLRPSPVLVAMGVPTDRLKSSVRFSLGATTTEGEVDDAMMRIVAVVRRLAPLAEG
ncbi:cysteine desulfurase family protein [Isosphaeraceae bacterium EP7]